MSEPIYLDNHSATKPFLEVLDIAERASKDYWGAGFSPHFIGQQQAYPLARGEKSLLESLGAGEGDFLFFSSGSAEGLYHILLNTYLQITKQTGKTLILTGQTEEMPLKLIAERMESFGCLIREIPVNSKGQITGQALAKAITPKTAIFSCSWANGLTGTIQPIWDLAEVCRENNILFHVDVSYLVGKVFFRFQDLGADFVTLDGSLVHALPGTGVTFVKKGTSISPFIPGRFSQSVAEVSALAHAAFEMQEKFEHYSMETVRLRDLLESEILRRIPEAIILCKDADRLPNCFAVAFPGIYAEALLYLLHAKGIYASIGGGRFQELEKILLSMGSPPHIASAAISFSLAWDTVEEEVLRAAEEISFSVKQLQECSKGVFL